MNRNEIVRRLDEIKMSIDELRPTGTRIEGDPQPVAFMDEAKREQLLKLKEEERRLLAMLTQPPGGSVE